jgi:hypothetical protein
MSNILVKVVFRYLPDIILIFNIFYGLFRLFLFNAVLTISWERSQVAQICRTDSAVPENEYLGRLGYEPRKRAPSQGRDGLLEPGRLAVLIGSNEGIGR